MGGGPNSFLSPNLSAKAIQQMGLSSEQLDPESRAELERRLVDQEPLLKSLTVEQARALESGSADAAAVDQTVAISDRTIQGPGGALPIPTQPAFKAGERMTVYGQELTDGSRQAQPVDAFKKQPFPSVTRAGAPLTEHKSTEAESNALGLFYRQCPPALGAAVPVDVGNRRGALC